MFFKLFVHNRKQKGNIQKKKNDQEHMQKLKHSQCETTPKLEWISTMAGICKSLPVV